MKVLIIFFSQSGGTEKLARRIHEGIKKSGNSSNLIKIKNVDITKLDDYDLIGLGCPTFFYREPVNIQRFIKNLPQMKGKQFFIFASHGSCLGNTFYYINEGLKEQGYQVIGAFDSYSDSSLQFYPTPMHTQGHPDAQELQEAEEFGEKICLISDKVLKGETNLIPQFELVTDTWWYRDSKMATIDVLRHISPKLIINEENCTKCLTCQEECPGDAIDISVDPPEIQKEGCIFCWACEKICPEGAIEADWTDMQTTFKGNLRKYVKLLKAAEAEGKFQPHIDYQKIK